MELKFKMVDGEKVYLNGNVELRVISEKDPEEPSPIISFTDSLPVNLVINGLLANDIQHKQWYLEQILEVMQVQKTDLQNFLKQKGFSFKDGVKP